MDVGLFSTSAQSSPTKRRKLSGVIDSSESIQPMAVDISLECSRKMPLTSLRSTDQEYPSDSPKHKTAELPSTPRAAPHKTSFRAFCSMEEEVQEDEEVSPKKTVRRQIPLCGSLRELFLDRRPWHTLDSRMEKHLAKQSPSLLQFVGKPRALYIS